MLKNTASQKIELFAFNTSTGAPQTGDAANLTAYVGKDGGTLTALADTTATEMSSTNGAGWYSFDLAQAETNADKLLFTGKSTTANVVVVGQPWATRPANFTALAIDSSGNVKVQSGMKKNAAFRVEFQMTDSTTHNPATGKTVTITRGIDGGSFSGGTISAVTETANGWYYADFAAADMNGTSIRVRATASGCDDLPLLLIPAP